MTEDRARSFLEIFRTSNFAIMGLFLAWALFGRVFGYLFTYALNVLYYPMTSYG